ncbi:dihydrofolate reductase [Chitinophaga sp. Mgbs1]|uniref:Dihydrofolate reductase n=1 Tax=Chitinophaga solisilvae TaxID=1233460 RepID=A0A433WL57_9BACT|nr:dihydrofolate reductase [Chitinophaga solisilvae]
MRKVVFQMMVSLDGYFEGPNREIDWHNVSGEFDDYAHQLLDSADTLLFGRITYEMMVSYWPSRMAIENDPVVAAKMNGLPKIVFSRTLKSVDWQNTVLISNNIAAEVSRLKNIPGKDLLLLGSSNLALSLLSMGLIDECQLIVNPVMLGQGRKLFQGITSPLHLQLLETKKMDSGNVVLYYKPG